MRIGALHQFQERDRREETTSWTFAGTIPNPTPYLNQIYVNQEAHMGFRNIPGPSAVRAWDAYKANPALLTQTTAQLVAGENTRLNTSEFAAETVTSYYFQGVVCLLSNRLHALTGVRPEETKDEGQGTRSDPNAVYVRKADGTIAHNAQGARIRKPEAGAAASVQEALLVRTERAYTAERSYRGYYPSLHLTYNIEENFIGRVATGADLRQVGLDPRYAGWRLTTKFNSGDARISGVEFNARHSLRQLGEWGRYFAVFANATRLKLQGNPYASFTSFIPKTANWRLSFNWKRITVVPKWNYRGLNKLIAQPALGPDGFQYIKPRTIVDLSLAYQLTKQISLNASFSNVFNNNLTQMHYSSATPAYARRSLNGEYGVAFTLGIRGTY